MILFALALAAADRPGAACAREAAPSIRPVIVRRARATGARIVARLAAGRPVYLCERRGGWTRLQFPRPGEHADCRRRAAGRACPTGWITGRPVVRAVD